MSKNKAAQALGKLGGAKSGGMKTPAQIAARRENMNKATAARVQRAKDKRVAAELDAALRNPADSDDTDLHMPWTY